MGNVGISDSDNFCAQDVKRRPGRPAFAPTADDREKVEQLAGFGIPHEHIAALVCGGISRNALEKHFEAELVSGKAKANAQVGQTLFQKAIGGDTGAAIWWSKTQMRWMETRRNELSGPDGSPVQANVTLEIKGV